MKNFFDSKDEKITEKAFSQSLIISVVSILLCIVALCSITYAWFTSETTSGINTLKSGSFDLTVSVTQTSTGGTDNVINASADGTYTLVVPGTYTVILNPVPEASVKGHCVVKIDGNLYKTDVIIDDDMLDDVYTTKTAPFEFTIVTQKETVVSFEARWGVLNSPDVKKGATITVGNSSIVIEDDVAIP